MTKMWLFVVVVLLMSPLAHAQGLGTTAPTATVAVAVNAEAALTIQTTALTLTQTGSNFADYTGTTGFTYFIRTKESGGTGSIVLQVTTDFSNGSGNTPSVAAPPTNTDTLKYSCSVPSPATACTGPVQASTTATTSVASFGTAAHSPKAGVASSVSWVLSNDPLYPTGTYTATITYTISAA